MLTFLLTWYQKLGMERRAGFSSRSRMALHVAETFIRRSYSPGYEEDLRKLLAPLDTTSRAVVEKVIARHRYIFTHNLLRHGLLFDPDETARQPEIERELKASAQRLNIPLKLTEASVHFYHHGLRHTDLPEDLSRRFEGKAVIDVGAAIGDSAYIFEKFYHPAQIHSFECDPNRLELLKDFLRRHDLKKVVLSQEALGPDAGQLPDGTPMRALDDYVAETGINVGLIKMDVEGAEEDVLRGAAHTLKSQKPLLIVSMYHNGQQFFDLLPLILSIQPDYQFAVRKLDDQSPVYETTLFAW